MKQSSLTLILKGGGLDLGCMGRFGARQRRQCGRGYSKSTTNTSEIRFVQVDYGSEYDSDESGEGSEEEGMGEEEEEEEDLEFEEN